MNPRITVLIPVFNRQVFIAEALESVLAQSGEAFEVVVVDDGSTDDTPAILRAFAERDARVVVITAPQNCGIAPALNLGLQHARGEYVARLDSDDVMSPGRLAAQAAVLDGERDVVLVSSAYAMIDRDGCYLGTFHVDEPHEVVTWLLHFTNSVGGHGQVMYRRADVLAAGGYDPAFRASEDYDLWVRLLRRGRIHTLSITGMRQRQHDDRATIRFATEKRANWTAIIHKSLDPYLGRTVRDEEIDALLAVWHGIETTVKHPAAIAERVMREAYARFRDEHRDPELRRRVRVRVARQWMAFAHRANGVAWMRAMLHAARWRVPT